jgi:hypothetical protein
MTRSLPFALRHIVLLALAPAACGGALSPSEDHGGTGDAATSDGPGHGGDASTGTDAGLADAVGFPEDATGHPNDAAYPYDAPYPVDSPVCTQYEDGGTGPCAPTWIQGDGCNGGQVLFPCGLPPSTGTFSCLEYCMESPSLNFCYVVDGDGGYVGMPYQVDAGPGPVVVACYQNHTGRRPATLVEEPDGAARSVGDVLARSAYLEAASVEAFLDLARQLEAHGAPRALIRRLRRAAMDEVRHARDVGALARAYGAEPPAVRVEASGERSLLAIALENAREGCVRETWGAACAVVQSMRAADPRVRETMRSVARDELAHAALSWDVARWIEARLSPEERAEVARERGAAERQLELELEEGLPPEAWRATLGLPSRDEARAILQGMHAEVWADAA